MSLANLSVWEKKAAEEMRKFCSNCEDWTTLDRIHHASLLEYIVGAAMFGIPPGERENVVFGKGFLKFYDVNIQERIEKIVKKIYDLTYEENAMGTITIKRVPILYKEDESKWGINCEIQSACIMGIWTNYEKGGKNESEICHLKYVDHEGRKYDSWNDYLDNNHLPRGKICYAGKTGIPVKGATPFFKLLTPKWNEATVGGYNIAQGVSTVAAIAGTVCCFFFAPVGFLLGIGSAVVMGVKAIVDIKDKIDHGEELDIWDGLNIAATVLAGGNFFLLGTVKFIPAIAGVVGSSKYATLGVKIISAGMATTGVTCSLAIMGHTIYEKVVSGEPFTWGDAVKIAAFSALLLGMVLNTCEIFSILKEVEDDVQALASGRNMVGKGFRMGGSVMGNSTVLYIGNKVGWYVLDKFGSKYMEMGRALYSCLVPIARDLWDLYNGLIRLNEFFWKDIHEFMELFDLFRNFRQEITKAVDKFYNFNSPEVKNWIYSFLPRGVKKLEEIICITEGENPLCDFLNADDRVVIASRLALKRVVRFRNREKKFTDKELVQFYSVVVDKVLEWYEELAEEDERKFRNYPNFDVIVKKLGEKNAMLMFQFKSMECNKYHPETVASHVANKLRFSENGSVMVVDVKVEKICDEIMDGLKILVDKMDEFGEKPRQTFKAVLHNTKIAANIVSTYLIKTLNCYKKRDGKVWYENISSKYDRNRTLGEKYLKEDDPNYTLHATMMEFDLEIALRSVLNREKPLEFDTESLRLELNSNSNSNERNSNKFQRSPGRPEGTKKYEYLLSLCRLLIDTKTPPQHVELAIKYVQHKFEETLKMILDECPILNAYKNKFGRHSAILFLRFMNYKEYSSECLFKATYERICSDKEKFCEEFQVWKRVEENASNDDEEAVRNVMWEKVVGVGRMAVAYYDACNCDGMEETYTKLALEKFGVTASQVDLPEMDMPGGEGKKAACLKGMSEKGKCSVVFYEEGKEDGIMLLLTEGCEAVMTCNGMRM